MPSLMAMFGLDGSAFKAGLDKAVSQAAKTAPTLESKLFGALKQSRLFQIIASPIGAATSLFTVFAAKVGSTLNELLARAKEIKKLSAETQLNKQDTQRVLYGAQGAGIEPDAAGKAILKIAEAQEKVKKGGEGSAKALAAFSEMGVTLADIKSKSYDQLFFQISQSLDVGKQTAGQMAAGVELMGKSFESLEPLFKRGFNNPLDAMKMLTDEEIKRLDELNLRSSKLHAIWSAMWEDLAAHAGSGLAGILGIGGDEAAEIDQDAAMKRNQAKIDARLAERAKAENKAAQRKAEFEEASYKASMKASMEREKSEKAVHELRAKSQRGELNTNQRLGAFAGGGKDAHLSVAQQSLNVQTQTLTMQQKILAAMDRAARARNDKANEQAFLHGDFS